MKYFSILFLIVAVWATGCSQKEEGILEIDSLSCEYNEFYSLQLAKLWMCVKSDNLFHCQYEWSCDGGRFAPNEPQGFNEITWLTPEKPGIYTVSCKVTLGKKTETRQRSMWVSNYFFQYFEGTSHTWTASNVTQNMRKDPNNKGYLEFNVNSNTALTGNVNYTFSSNNPNLKLPFSVAATLGWISNMPADSIAIGTSKTANSMGYQLDLDRDRYLDNSRYINMIQFFWYPVGSASDQMPVDPVSGEKYNGMFLMRENTTGTTVNHRIFLYHPELQFDAGQYKKVALNISSDNIISAYVGVAKVFETDALKTWLNDSGYLGDVRITRWNVVIPNGPGGVNPPVFYMTNTVATNDGGIYTGQQP